MSVPLMCAPSLAAAKKFEFLAGDTVCVDKDRVIGGKVSAISGGGQKLTSISVSLDSTSIELTPDKLPDDTYFRDLAAFIGAHPESVTSEADGDLLRVDVLLRPPAEVDSMRLLDRLVSGNGTFSLIGSRSIRNLRVGLPNQQLADIFLAMCWSDQSGGSRCQRQFPILGFRAAYPLTGTLKGVTEKDEAIRSGLAKVVKSCD